MRVAVIDYTLCKPSKCNLECIRFCPINRSRVKSKAIELDGTLGKPVIYEETCIGCNICVKKCPFSAIQIENVPDELEKKVVHRYGRNAFKLYGLPIPKREAITGIIGKNGTGKTTSIRILAGEIVPNMGEEGKADWDSVIKRFRGSELQGYFEKLANKELRVVHKIQYVDLAPRKVKGTVGELLNRADERGLSRELIRELGLEQVRDRRISHLSGGELQRFLIATVLCKDAHVYIFDEPSSYLDVRERVNVARAIREYTPRSSYVLVVEHDLAVLDYLSDHVSIIYGEPGVYGIVSNPYGVKTGINSFLEGYLPAENMRIRREPIRFHATEPVGVAEALRVRERFFEWSRFKVKLNGFALEASAGSVGVGEVIGIVGPNGIGKTTFVRALIGELKDSMEGWRPPEESGLRISYKPQYVTRGMFKDTVASTLQSISQHALSPGHWHYDEIVKPLGLARLREREVSSLSGGELQKLAVAATLLREAEIYMLDEPSAYLDVEERLAVAKIIRKITEARGGAAFVVEHDASIVDFISHRIIVFRGAPGREGVASEPMDLRSGMNAFLRELAITFRRDPQTGRPRINKPDSYLDRLQKRLGEYYYIPKEGEDR
uniref:Ribosome biogenesis/translation initiation ATPase RLI n=1 Tax=Fervidicoccus fontis TaxID=683846 RepID=A0A7J3ZI99_9CREN